MMPNIFDQQSLWNTVLGVMVSGAGLSALALSLFRWNRGNIPLATFGATSLLYGVRHLVEIQMDLYVGGPPPQILFYGIAFISYVIPVPLSAFVLYLFGGGWKDSMRWAYRMTLVFALSGLVSDLVQSVAFSLERLNNILVVVWACVVTGNALWSGLRISRELWVVLSGFMLFGLFAVNENLVALDALPWQWRNESLGFLAFLVALGYVAGHRFFTNEKQLMAVQQEMETARRIQFSILPSRMPSIEGLTIAARYVPMTAVAGDFYDVVHLGHRRLSILVADVSGHGVGAALIASMIKVAFASQTFHMSSPSKVLEAINRILGDKMEHHFITAGCCFLDIDERTMRYAGAGHPPLLLWRRTEKRMIEGNENGLLLGPFPDATYSNLEIQLEPGDRILLYTDGIIEAANSAGILFGDESWRAFITKYSDVPAEQFSDLFLKHLFSWSGKPPGDSLDDDVTLIVVDLD